MHDHYNEYDEYDEYESDSHADYLQVPETVRNFLEYLYNCIREGLVFEVQNLYEISFPKFSEQFFEKSTWPEASVVAPFVDKDPVFLALYKELYFRHIYATKRTPSIDHQINSFCNYCHLFNLIATAQVPLNLELPDQWLWELIDEFIYQFQTFSQYRTNISARTKEELSFLESPKIWDILCVLNVLHCLIDKSKIKSQLEVYASGGDPDSVAGSFGRLSLYKMLGYFSMAALLRVHSLLGDYHQAIKSLENVELYKKSAYSHIPGCQISTAYYVGFAYMMMRRYADAIRTFSGILLYIQRTKQLFMARSYQNDQINKQTERMYNLLAICLVLHPQCIDEGLQQGLRERNFYDRMYKMQCGDLSEFETCFFFACPKFLSLAPPNPDDPSTDNTVEATRYQIEVFKSEVLQQKKLPTIRSYLKLYTTLPLAKLAELMQHLSNPDIPDEEEDLKTYQDKKVTELTIHLLCFKHKMKNIVWTKGPSGLEGKFQSDSELDFYIDNDMIHIADTKVAHRYGDFFIRKILKFEELNRKLHLIKI